MTESMNNRAIVPTTEDEAREMGWTVDRHCYPWVAYLGPRFSPDRIVDISTPAFGREVPREVR